MNQITAGALLWLFLNSGEYFVSQAIFYPDSCRSVPAPTLASDPHRKFYRLQPNLIRKQA
ncbi:MAG: hypothetical protein BGO59_00315 [Spirosoma sp. 48-14]|nr:MAG: hypothetical protein BGO59_00315 [Spirosoma sp. 48-14]